jgi:cellulose synthase/poly-beta-1,6-N-acetylglucosamine synthase-like glycosyltransferase
VHSHGLGVLQLNNAPDNKKLEWLQSSSPEKQKLLNYFAALGSRQLERFELNELKQRASSLTQVVAERDGQIVNLKYSVAPASTLANPRFKASIIIPVFNKLDLTRQCLTTLASLTTMPEYEVIVVDNASSDVTVEFLAELGGDVQVIRNPENYGFAVACNQGAKAARGEFLLFLNNDTIPTEGWLNALVDEIECHPDVAVVGSKLLYEDGTIQHAGVAFSRIVFTPYHIYRKFPADSPMVNRRREFQCVTAACMLVRRNVFEQVGQFDEGFKNGFEDVDLCRLPSGKSNSGAKNVRYRQCTAVA